MRFEEPLEWRCPVGRYDARRGLKPFSCEIVLRADLVAGIFAGELDLMKAALLSAGYTPHDFVANRGWEEGVVEQAQRVLRSDLLAHIGVPIDET